VMVGGNFLDEFGIEAEGQQTFEGAFVQSPILAGRGICCLGITCWPLPL
jgi:hypothetical protein